MSAGALTRVHPESTQQCYGVGVTSSILQETLKFFALSHMAKRNEDASLLILPHHRKNSSDGGGQGSEAEGRGISLIPSNDWDVSSELFMCEKVIPKQY